MKILKRYVFKNILWKCLSVILAVMLWFICINIVNPITTRTFSNRLIIKNLDILEANGYVLLNKDELESRTVSISVRAPSDSFPHLTGAFFQPYIDISPINYLGDAAIGQNQPVNIYVEQLSLAADMGLVPVSIEVDPLVAHIRLDKVTEVRRTVSVNVSGEPQENYTVLAGTAFPDSVRITGPSTVLNSISSVTTDINVSGADSYITRTCPVRILDIDGRDITSRLEIDSPSIEVTVPVNMFGRIPVRFAITGEPAPGYTLISVSRSIDYVDVSGKEEELKETAYITFADIDISNLAETKTFTLDINKELEGTSLYVVEGEPVEFTVTVMIEPLAERELRLVIMSPSKVEGLAEEHAILPFDLNFTVTGLGDVIETFDITMVTVELDVTGLNVGRHRVAPVIGLPNGVSVKDAEVFVNIIIEEFPSETSESIEEGETNG